MNRRHLLNLLAGAALAPTVLAEPPRTYFLPPRGGWLGKGGTVLTADMIRKAKAILYGRVYYQGRLWPRWVVRNGNVYEQCVHTFSDGVTMPYLYRYVDAIPS